MHCVHTHTYSFSFQHLLFSYACMHTDTPPFLNVAYEKQIGATVCNLPPPPPIQDMYAEGQTKCNPSVDMVITPNPNPPAADLPHFHWMTEGRPRTERVDCREEKEGQEQTKAEKQSTKTAASVPSVFH